MNIVDQKFIEKLAISNSAKIVLVVLDGLGGLTSEKTGKTELETANTKNMDELAKISQCGFSYPIAPGITPGSGPAHLALFGYDPIKYEIGRGILGAVGIGFEIKQSDIASRANFCTVDEQEIITDRRAGRISTEKCKELCQLLESNIKVKNFEIFVRPEKEHRASVIFRKENAGGNLSDSDPQKEGLQSKEIKALDSNSEITAIAVNEFLAQAKNILKEFKPSNMMLLRGFSKYPDLPQMQDVYKVKSAAIATYPMYKGLAKLVGMEILQTGDTIRDEIKTLKENLSNFEFFYFHIKKTDSSGEDGNFDAKVAVLEDFDRCLPDILNLNPDVLVLTGDHSTPSRLKAHSWHPVPILLSSKYVISDGVSRWTERECYKGGLGHLNALNIMPLALAHSLKLKKYGA